MPNGACEEPLCGTGDVEHHLLAIFGKWCAGTRLVVKVNAGFAPYDCVILGGAGDFGGRVGRERSIAQGRSRLCLTIRMGRGTKDGVSA